MTHRNPFLVSMISRPAYQRVLGVLVILAALWLAILWAVSLP